MSSKILSNTSIKSLQPATLLWNMYKPDKAPLRFQAKTSATARKWRKKTCSELEKTIGFQDLPKSALKAKVIEKVDKGDYIREKILLQTTPLSSTPLYLLIPTKLKSSTPTVIAFHGHGYGVKDIVGLWEDGSERDTPDGYHKDFAVALCRQGFVVAAPEISCFGERQTDFSYLDTTLGQGAPTTCAHTAALASHLGGSALGLRIFEAKRVIDYLEKRKEVDNDSIGAMGISGGGMHTFFSACLDERIKACVVSGYYCSFKDSVLGMYHCSCNFVPGLWRFGEMSDLVGLIAPRPILVEAGSHDPIFPIKTVKKAVREARRVYDVFGAKEHVANDFFEGRHQINGIKAYPFLLKHLMTGK